MDANKLENIISGYRINADDAAWLRALPRLTPDRERVIAAVSLALDKWHSDEGDPRSSAEACADAAIKAMEGGE